MGRILTDEELLKLAEENADLPHEQIETNNIVAFLKYYKLEPGTQVYPKKSMYVLYKSWSDNPVPVKKFTKDVSRILNFDNLNFYTSRSPSEVAFKSKKKPKYHVFKTGRTQQHFQAFLNAYSVQEGTLWVQVTFLYNLYDKWLYKRHQEPKITPKPFTQLCKAFFEFKTIKGAQWVRINKSILSHLTPEQIVELSRKKVNEEEQTVPDQVSSPKQTPES